ncbi:MAG: DUF3617 family protein [Alphaproteobacteria bacterium]
MTRTMLILALAGVAVTFAGCNKAGSGEAKTEAAPAAEAIPTPGAGLWEQAMMGEGLPQITSTICLDAATASRGFGSDPKDVQCSERTFHRTADGWSFSSTCQMPSGGTVTSNGSVTGNVGSDYTVTLQSVTTGAAQAAMNGSHTMTVHAVRKGDCPAGMAPGEARISGMPGMPAGMKLPAGVKMPNMPSAPK